VFDRRGIGVVIRSPHAVITTGRRPKEGFPDVVTLHALVAPPSGPGQAGTDITLFSYNITKLSAQLRRSLYRERSNVGRGAYSDRVKTILTACRPTAVAGPGGVQHVPAEDSAAG
jgi:hypothetical protein